MIAATCHEGKSTTHKIENACLISVTSTNVVCSLCACGLLCFTRWYLAIWVEVYKCRGKEEWFNAFSRTAWCLKLHGLEINKCKSCVMFTDLLRLSKQGKWTTKTLYTSTHERRGKILLSLEDRISLPVGLVYLSTGFIHVEGSWLSLTWLLHRRANNREVNTWSEVKGLPHIPCDCKMYGIVYLSTWCLSEKNP